VADSKNYVFRSISRRMQFGPADPRGALRWFRETARELGAVSRATPGKILDAKDIVTLQGLSREVVGNMLCYYYDPKHKVTLPYYDRFPMIFVVDLQSDGFHGLNLHYLPPLHRAKLMDALYSLRTNPRTLDSKTRLNVSYQILKASSRMKLFKPCFKKYLFGHVRSPFKRVNPPDWDKILLMPIARFAKAVDQKVWEDSLKAAGERPQKARLRA